MVFLSAFIALPDRYARWRFYQPTNGSLDRLCENGTFQSVFNSPHPGVCKRCVITQETTDKTSILHVIDVMRYGEYCCITFSLSNYLPSIADHLSGPHIMG